MTKRVVVDGLTQDIARGVLHDCLEDGNVIPGKHFRDELAAEKLTFEDALFVMRSGAVVDAPEFDIGHGEWKYKVEGWEPGSKWIVITFSFKKIDTVFLITVYSVESKRRDT